MQNNYQLARLITLLLYFLEGLVVVLVREMKGETQISVTLVMIGLWLISFMLLLYMNDEHGVSRNVFYIAEAFFSCVLACALAYETGNVYLMILVFCVQWAACTLYLDKLVCRNMLGMQIFFVVVVMFAAMVDSSYEVNWNEFLVAVIVLVCICWITEILVNYIKYQNRMNREQGMSLDDMLKLVEAMCEEAQLAAKSKSVFLSNMSHEIRTPINAVLGMNEMILRECKDEQILSYAENIQSSGKTLLFLINDILDMSKIESGKMEIVVTEYEMADVIMDLWNVIYLRAQEKNLTVDFVVDETLPRMLFGDEVRIKQIVTNLLTNAVKYTSKGGIELYATYKRTGEDMMDLIISVKDTGMGIRQEDMGKLFESFRRLEEEKNRNIEGTGLGMNITMSLLKLMGGDIKVESEYQKGSTFTVTIPQMVLSGETTGDFKSIMGRHRPGAVQSQESFKAPEAKVLVVDDNDMNLVVFKALLKRTKMNIVTADSGKDCLELVKTEQFNIIFMDHMMPEMDGIETLHEIQKLTDFPNAKTPVIALTANALSGAREFYLEEGFVDFLTKPIDADLLEQMVVTHLPKELVQKNAEGDAQVTIESSDAQKPVSESISKKDKLICLKEKGFHTEEGLVYCCRNKEFYENLLLKFAKSSESKIADIEAAFQKEDIKNYEIMVHALKSTSKTLGADTLSEMAKEAEKAAKKQDTAYIRENHEELIGKYRETVQCILDVLSPTLEAAAEGTEISKDELLKRLSELRKGLDTFEVSVVEDLLREMNGLVYQGTSVSELLRDVRQDAENFELIAAGEKVEALIGSMEDSEA